TFCGTNMAGWSHVQIQTLGVLPFATFCLLRALDTQSRWWGAAAGFATALVALSAGYWAALWMVVAPVLVVLHVARRRGALRREFVTMLTTTAAVAVALLLPAAYAYLHFGKS